MSEAECQSDNDIDFLIDSNYDPEFGTKPHGEFRYSGFVVTRRSDKTGDRLFLVDKIFNRNFWWSFDRHLAKVFKTRRQAKDTAGKLRYGNPKVFPTESVQV